MNIKLYCQNCEQLTECRIEVSEPALANHPNQGNKVWYIDVEAEAVCTECNCGIDIDRETFVFSVKSE